jgi:tetratricopeptide (TPR) repeat protein
MSAFNYYVQLYFIRKQYQEVSELVNKVGTSVVEKKLINSESYDNSDAWTSYRIAESYLALQQQEAAIRWFKKAVALAPFNLEFRQKLAGIFASAGQLEQAKNEYEWVMAEHPKISQVYSNLGYVHLMQGRAGAANRLYKIGLDLDPDNEALLLNLAGYYLYMKNEPQAMAFLKRIVKINPGNQRAIRALSQLQQQP